MKNALSVLFLIILFSTTALCQEPEKIKINKADSAKIEQIRVEKKKYEEAVKQFQILELLENTIIESAFNHEGIPVPQRKEYNQGNVLYLKDEKK